MSQAISEKSSPSAKRVRVNRNKSGSPRSAFLRLYGDLIDEMNAAVALRVNQGRTHAMIAEMAGIDASVLSKVLSGRAGNNVRTLAAVLYGTDHRLKMEAVACEQLKIWSDSSVTIHVNNHYTVETEKIDDVWCMKSDIPDWSYDKSQWSYGKKDMKILHIDHVEAAGESDD